MAKLIFNVRLGHGLVQGTQSSFADKYLGSATANEGGFSQIGYEHNVAEPSQTRH